VPEHILVSSVMKDQEESKYMHADSSAAVNLCITIIDAPLQSIEWVNVLFVWTKLETVAPEFRCCKHRAPLGIVNGVVV
jgi:hypothetical protein